MPAIALHRKRAAALGGTEDHARGPLQLEDETEEPRCCMFSRAGES